MREHCHGIRAADAAPGHSLSNAAIYRSGQFSGIATYQEIDDFRAYGTVTKLTTVDGRIPDAQRWLPGVVSARLNIRVRSTTARML